MVPSVSKARSIWEVQTGQSPLPKTILRFLSLFYGVQKVWVIYSTEFTTWLMIFQQKKINIELKYLLEKFGNSGESNSCPCRPVKGQNYWDSVEHWHVCSAWEHRDLFFYIFNNKKWPSTIQIQRNGGGGGGGKTFFFEVFDMT